MPFQSVGSWLTLILSVMVGIRPFSEIFWQHKFLGANLQSHLTLILFLVSCIVLVSKNSIEKKYLPFYLTASFFLIFIGISSVLNYDTIFFRESLKIITSFTIGTAIFLCLPRDRFRNLFILFGISILTLIVIAYLQKLGLYEFHYFTGSVIKRKSIGRVSGGLSHPNDLTRSVVFFLFISLFFLKNINKYIRFVTILCIFPPIYWTYHRTTYLCAIFIVFWYLFYRRKYVQIGILFLLFSSIVVIKFDWISYFIFEERLDFSQGFESSRFWYSYESIKLFCEAPFWHKLFGSGIFPSGRKYGDGDLPRILYAYGIVGFFAYFSVLFSIIIVFLKNIGRDTVFYALGLFGIWLSFSIFTDVSRYPAFIIMLFVCLRFITQIERDPIRICL